MTEIRRGVPLLVAVQQRAPSGQYRMKGTASNSLSFVERTRTLSRTFSPDRSAGTWGMAFLPAAQVYPLEMLSYQASISTHQGSVEHRINQGFELAWQK
jgi:hypothetical protein